MPRYIKQRDKSSCVPIAIMNAAKFMGYRTTYADLKTFRTICNSKKGLGTNTKDITKAMRLLGFKIHDINYSPNINNIDKYIKSGHSIILAYTEKANCSAGHCVFMPSKIRKKYLLINDGADKAEKLIDRLILNKMLKYSSVVWEIGK